MPSSARSKRLCNIAVTENCEDTSATMVEREKNLEERTNVLLGRSAK